MFFFFISFFPVFIQPPISVLSNSVYSIFVKAGICRKTVRRVDIASAPTGITVALPGIRSLDMDRRKYVPYLFTFHVIYLMYIL